MKTDFEVRQEVDVLKRVADTREFTMGAWELVIDILLDIRLICQLVATGLIRKGGGQ